MSAANKKTEWTSDQKNVVFHSGGDLLVSASAGCGKTSVMNARIARLILSGKELSKMIITTFTKAAAADMKNKLGGLLSEIAAEGGSVEAEFAARAVKELPRAQISTLHSLCGRLIKDYFYVAGIDPEAEILEENDADSILYGCAEQLVTSLYGSCGDGSELFENICEIMMKDRSLRAVSDEVVRIYKYAVVRPDFYGCLDSCQSAYSKHGEYIDIALAAAEYERLDLERNAQSLLKQTYEAGFKRNYAACDDLYESIVKRKACSARIGGTLPDSPELLALNKRLSDLKKKYKAFCDNLSGIASAPEPVESGEYARVFIDLVKRLKEMYDGEKNRRAYMDYNDLEHFALRILADGSVRRDLVERFEFMYVDEYQDINPIQEELINKIPLEKFFVGDIKQSIYSFRLCDPTIFMARQDRYSQSDGGKALLLNANFRSSGEILQFSNDLFSAVMTKKFGGVDYGGSARFEPRPLTGEPVQIDVVVPDLVKSEPQLDFYSVEKHADADIIEDMSLIDAEINLVVNRIYDIMAGDPDAANGKIAVLLRTINGEFCFRLKEKLKREGLDFSAPDKKQAGDCRAVAVLIEYLRLISNRNNDIALAAVLRSPLGGFSDGELCLIRTAAETVFFYEAADLYRKNGDEPLKSKLNAFFDGLDRYTALACTLTASQTAGIICADKEYFNYVFASSGGRSEAAELAAFLDSMDSSVNNTSVFDYVRALEKYMPVIDIPVKDDAIKIMSIHSSKGLEFDYVILADAGKGFNYKDLRKEIVMGRQAGFALKNWDFKGKQSTPTSFYNAVVKKGMYEIREEEMRILYVAVTRAKKSLYITARGDKDKERSCCPQRADCYLDWFFQGASDYMRFIPSSECVFAEREGERVMYRKPDEALSEQIGEYIGLEPAVSCEPVKISVTALLKRQKIGDENDDTAQANVTEYYADHDRAMDRGTAYHKFLELFDYSKDFESEYVRTSAVVENAALADAALLKDAFGRLREYIGGRRFFREMPFIAETDLGEFKKPVLVQGVIDLIIEDGGFYEIIDYKSGRINGEKLSSYSTQLALYKSAVERILKTGVSKTGIYAIEDGRFIATK